MKANIFDIKRFGTNDGNGIRTVIFIKGCPLRCCWCHNPEGLKKEVGIWRTLGNCINCKSCVSVCKYGAITLNNNDEILLNSSACVFCGKCVLECPTGAMCYDSTPMSVSEVIAEIEKDRVFYRENGGVTLSGGEPTFSPEFSVAVLKECKNLKINTAVETCLYAPLAVIKDFMEVTDSFIADIKLLDIKRHKYETGVNNARILENIKYIAQSNKDLLLRIPLIPGHTADEENLLQIAMFLQKKGISSPVQLINYNPLCEGKYLTLRKKYIEDAPKYPYSNKEMKEFADILYKHNINVIL